MKITFVGINNKAGFEPLDSRTSTGQIIDSIIFGFRANIADDWEYRFEKTNLYLQNNPEKFDDIHAMILHDRCKSNLYILLGKEVQNAEKALKLNLHTKIILLDHPAYAMRRGKVSEYLTEAIEKLLECVRV